MNEIITAKTAGFCFGVKRAIEISEKAAEKYGRAYTLGQLIHNNDVINDLKERGIMPVDRPEDSEGCIIIRSHGVGQAVYDRIAELGLKCEDATCPFVERIHRIVAENTADGSDLLVIGDKDHPEVIGTMGFAGGRAKAVGSIEEDG